MGMIIMKDLLYVGGRHQCWVPTCGASFMPLPHDVGRLLFLPPGHPLPPLECILNFQDDHL